jgi:hypothetical protein
MQKMMQSMYSVQMMNPLMQNMQLLSMQQQHMTGIHNPLIYPPANHYMQPNYAQQQMGRI